MISWASRVQGLQEVLHLVRRVHLHAANKRSGSARAWNVPAVSSLQPAPQCNSRPEDDAAQAQGWPQADRASMRAVHHRETKWPGGCT